MNGNNNLENNSFQNPYPDMNAGMYYQNNTAVSYYVSDPYQSFQYYDNNKDQENDTQLEPVEEGNESFIPAEQQVQESVVVGNDLVEEVIEKTAQNNPVDDILKTFGSGGSIYKK